jgi:TrmH family RNA methyltransferase
MAGELPRVASRANPLFKALRTLAQSAAARRQEGRTLLDGPHLIGAYLRHATPLLIAVSDDALDDPETRALLARGAAAAQVRFPRALFDQIAPVQTPTGILALIAIPSPASAAAGDCLVLLDGIQDPGNVGTIMRSAAGAGADAVLLSAQCADAWSPRTLRAAMGAHFELAVHTQCDLPQFARNFGGKRVAAVGRGGEAPFAVALTGRIALAFGAEGAGLSEPLARLAAAKVSIPLAPGVESLNVGAAAAVILFERVRQLGSRRGSRGRAQ